MFKQFLTQVTDSQVYLITSLGIFMLFFLLVALLLIFMKKEQIDYMSSLPLNDDENGND
jgi:cbb3-type cytochrome oxidase subunit 3